MFGPKVLEAFTSNFSGQVEVRKLGRDLYVTTGGLTQSGGLINELWTKTFKKIPKKELLNKKWLILGLATGTVAKIIAQKYAPLQMVGVEIDPLMLEVGYNYFGLDQIPNLEIVTADANDYVHQTKQKFDWVVIDTYVGDQLPTFVYDQKFLIAIKRLAQRAIFNHLFYDAAKKIKAETLVRQLKMVFPTLKLHRELTNLLVICG